MKRIFSAIILGVSFILFGAGLSGCTEEMVDINDEVSLGRCLTPTELSAKIVNGEFIEFSWTKSKGATEFVLELYTDEQMTNRVEEIVIPAEDLPYTADLEADMTYYARVKGVNGEGLIADSHWAVFDRALQTYAIKSSLNPELVDRSASSITIKWTKDPEVDHIRITPAVNADEEYTRFDVTADVAGAAQVEVTGLKPSVNYTLAVHFKSAQRGTVSVWTRPSVEGATEVATAEALIQAITDKAPVIKVAYSEAPYIIGSVVLGGPVAIYGDATAQGAQPTIQGGLKIGADVTSVHLEALTFDGAGLADYPHNLTFDAAATVESITVVNCKLNNYLRGVLYENSMAPTVGSIKYDGVEVNNVTGSGGDCFDFRGKATVNSIEFINSTLNTGARTWFRVDANTVLESIKLTHCTFNNLCFANDGNNNGIFNIRALNKASKAPTFILTHNVFLNMNDDNKKCCLVAKNSTSAFPTEISNNFFFNCFDRFFVAQKDGSTLSGDDLKAAAAEGRARILVNGSSELVADPCVDSARDKYNVTSKEVIEANAGDPRWYTAYVEIPEDLTQEVTATGKIWDLTDGQTFKKMADKDMVRDGIRFFVKNTPINFTKEGFEFTGEAVLEGGVPVDGAIGIKVNEPGSIVISVAEAAGHSNLTVSLDGKVSASVPAGAEYQKVTFANVSGEQMIYIYGCHPATMTFLQWTSDVQVLDKVLATPQVKISKTTVNERAEDEITLTWDAVDYAGSYNVTVDGKKKSVTETSYTFATGGYAVEEAGGDFAIQVTAVPAADDYTRVESQPAELSFHVNDVPDEPGEVAGIAGVIKFDDYVGKASDGTLATEFEAGSIKLTVVADDAKKMAVDANSCSFGTADAVTAYTTRFKTGATSGAASALKLTVAAKGTIKIAVRTGSNSSVRNLKVVKAGVEVLACELDETKQKHTTDSGSYYDYFTTDVDAGEYDLTYDAGAVNIYAIEYIPAPVGPVGVDGTIKFDDYVGKASDATLATEFEAGSVKLTVVADDAKKMAVDANSCSFGTADAVTAYTTRFKTGATSGAASALKLTVAAKGTIKIAVRTGSNSSIRNLKVVKAGVEVLACELDETKQKHTTDSGSYYDYFTADVDAGEYDLTYDAGAVNIYAIEYIAAK